MTDIFDTGDVTLLLRKLTIQVEKKTDKGFVQIFRHDKLGKVLVINQEIQHVEKWMPFYHEFVVHLPLSFINSPKSILILGGGSLFAASELLKYLSIEKIDIVDYNPDVVKIVAEYYPHAKSVLKDNRINIVNSDLKEFLKINKSKYDFILNDAIDVFSEIDMIDIYDLMVRNINSNGICSDLIYRHIFEKSTNQGSMKLVRERYNHALSLITVPEYPGILHLLMIFGKSNQISQNAKYSANNEQNILQNNKQYSIFNPNFLRYYLYIPPYLKEHNIL